MYVPSLDFQDTYWNENPFRQIIDDAQQTGVVHRSRLRVSQHLCAPLMNPNRRIGCSAPLNYDSLHLPPELRDFRMSSATSTSASCRATRRRRRSSR